MQRFIVRAVLGLVLIFGGGWILGGTLNLAALVDPQLVSKIECPAGSTVKEEFVQMSFDQPGQKTLTLSCLDASGNQVPMRSDADVAATEYRIFYTAGVVIMAVLVLGWFIWSAMRRKRAAEASS